MHDILKHVFGELPSCSEEDLADPVGDDSTVLMKVPPENSESLDPAVRLLTVV